MFSVYSHLGGTPVRFPVPSLDSGPRSFLGGGTLVSSPMSLPGEGYPNLWYHVTSGGTQVLAGVTPILGYPPARSWVSPRTGYAVRSTPRAVSRRRTFLLLLPPAYVVRREGTVFTGVCLSTEGEGGLGTPPGGYLDPPGGYPDLPGGVPGPPLRGRGVPDWVPLGGTRTPRGVTQNPPRGGTQNPPGGVPEPPRGVPGPPGGVYLTGYPPGGYPDPPGVPRPPQGGYPEPPPGEYPNPPGGGYPVRTT